MALRACPKCQHRFYQIMDDDLTRDNNTKEHYVMCSSCGSLLGTFKETEKANKDL